MKVFKWFLLFIFMSSLVTATTNVDYSYPNDPWLDRVISLNQSGNNITADYFFGNGSKLTGLAGGGDINAVNTPGQYLTGGAESGIVNLYLNETSLNTTIDNRASGLGDNASWNESYANTLYAILGYGDDWNETYANTLYPLISTVVSWINGNYTSLDNKVDSIGNWSADKSDYSTTTESNLLYAPINYGDDWNKTYADTLYSDITEPIASSLGNWSADKGDYYNRSEINDTFIKQTEKSNLNVNSSNYWDNLDTPANINVADLGDTSATGTELNTLTNNSIADTLHRHSELSASDGTPDQALVVDATGQVGIGTTAPLANLHIKATSVSSTPLRIDANDGSALFEVYEAADGRGATYVRDAAGAVKIYADSNGNSYFNGGNVGIGTVSPVSNLHVSTGGDDSVLIQNNVGTNGQVAGLRFKVAGNTNDEYQKAGIFFERDDASYPKGNLHFATDASTDAGNVDVTDADMTIDSSGNVGIGTTSPDKKLTLRSTSTTQDNYIKMYGWWQGYDSRNFQIFRGNVKTELISSGDTGYNTFAIKMNTSGTLYDAIDISQTGNVGIGTTSPGAKLTVVDVDQDDGSLYAFNGGANLEVFTNDSAAVGKGGTLSFGGSYTGTTPTGFGAIRGELETVGSSDGALSFFTTKSGVGSAEKMRIDSSGKVGIGTTSPNSALELGADDDLHISDGSICVENAGGTDCAGSTDGFVYADDFIEHSRSLPEEGLSAIMNMKNKEDGTLDHKSFPSYVSKEVSWNNTYENGTLTKEAGSKLTEGVSISSQIKYLIKGVQELKKENDLLKSELCDKNNSYSFCNIVLKEISPLILYECEATQQTKECPFEISGGIGTRCYKNIEHDSWFYCSSGWKLKWHTNI